MTLNIGSHAHLGDDDLLRYMDHQLDRTHQRDARLHLASCSACTERLQALEARAASVSGWLRELDAPVAEERREQARAAMQGARFRRRWLPAVDPDSLRMAAMIALLLSVAFATPPGRAWVREAMDRGGGEEPATVAEEAPAAVGPAGEAAPVTAPTSDAAPPATAPPASARAAGPTPGTSAPVAFNPGSNYVLLRFDSRQRAGSATISIRNVNQGSGQVVAGFRAEQLEPTADGLHVRNAGASRAHYSITIPNRYRYLRLRIANEEEMVIAISRARQDWLWNVSLVDDGR